MFRMRTRTGAPPPRGTSWPTRPGSGLAGGGFTPLTTGGLPPLTTGGLPFCGPSRQLSAPRSATASSTPSSAAPPRIIAICRLEGCRRTECCLTVGTVGAPGAGPLAVMGVTMVRAVAGRPAAASSASSAVWPTRTRSAAISAAEP